MPRQTFTPAPLPPAKAAICDSCGDEADHLFLADGPEDATGYAGSILLCDACLRKREAQGR